MTQDEIIDKDEVLKMAIKVGFTGTASEFYMKALEHFAKLVADKAIEAEREACAKVCEDLDAHRQVATWYSQAIRARGQQ